MEGDDIIQRQVSKFQKISCNGSSVISDTSSNPNKIGTHKGNHLFPVGDGGGSGGDGGGVGRLVGWPSSRIVRVSRASGGKDRHSKVLTSKGLRDRRIRLSVSTAIEFYDLQDRLGYDQPSKAVEWLIKAASSSIDELPSLDPSFHGGGCSTGTDNHHQDCQLKADNINKSVEHDTDFEDPNHQHHHHQSNNNNNNNNSNSNSNNNNACSSASDTSKGSGLSLSRSENRIRARERARDLAAKKEKVKESAISSSFTDLLTGGININNNLNPHMDYFQMPQFNNIPNNQHQQEHHHYTFLQGNYAPGLASSGLNRGTLQSNLLSSLPQHHHHQQQHNNNNNIQRTFQQATMVDGSTSVNFPFFIAPDHQFQADGYDSQRLQLYGVGGGGRHSDHYKEKSKN